MNSIPSQRELRLQAARAIEADGLTDLAAGVMLFIVALATGRPAFAWMYLVPIVLLGPGLHRIRARVTYPRIGYAKLPEADPKRTRRNILIWIVVVFAVTTFILGVTGQLGNNLAWRQMAPMIGGLLFAGGFAFLAQRTRFPRHWLLAVLSPVLGGLMTVPVIDEPYGNFRIWALLMGLACLAIGAVACARFVAAHPPIDDRGPDA